MDIINSSDTFLLPDEEHYESFMCGTVEPFLEEHRTEGYLNLRDERFLHYEYTLIPDAKGAVVISHGFLESAEKYREMTYWFTQMGFSVFAIDHCGHGRSTRIVKDFELTDVSAFSDYVSDFHCFVRRVVLPNTSDFPLYLYGHSMGGAVAILYAQAHPNVFRKIILNAPMLKPKTAGIPSALTYAMTSAFRLLGKAQDVVFVQKNKTQESNTFETSPDTSRARYDYYQKKCRAYPYYQNLVPTYRWINESLKIVGKMLNKERCARITSPVLLFSAGKDDYVFRREQEIFMSRIPNGETVYVEDAKHEIYMSQNDIMQDYLKNIQAFLTE